MESDHNEPEFNLRKWISNSMSFKVLLIVALIIVMLVPEEMVSNLVNERMQRSNKTISEISSKWGGIQVLDGPLLSIPIKSSTENRRFLHLYSEVLKVSAEIKPEIRNRGIFEAVLYSTTVQMKGEFKFPDKNELNIASEVLDFENAFLSFGVSDTSGITESVVIEVNGEKFTAKPGVSVLTGLENGFHIPTNINFPGQTLAFSTTLSLNGNGSFQVVPTGKNTDVTIESTWKDPSFTGSFLPVSRKVDDSGFKAVWKVHDLQRNMRNFWFDKESVKEKPEFGAKLIQVNDVYQRVQRVVKYAILFISFTFATVFISERLTGISIHPLQYLLTGLASVFFYVLLLSTSEHLSFNTAYLVTSTLITLIIAGYAKGIFKSVKMACTIGAVSSFLYMFLFSTLQLEDYALLMGSCGLLFILVVVMYLTKGINSEEQLLQI